MCATTGTKHEADDDADEQGDHVELGGYGADHDADHDGDHDGDGDERADASDRDEPAARRPPPASVPVRCSAQRAGPVLGPARRAARRPPVERPVRSVTEPPGTPTRRPGRNDRPRRVPEVGHRARAHGLPSRGPGTSPSRRSA